MQKSMEVYRGCYKRRKMGNNRSKGKGFGEDITGGIFHGASHFCVGV